MNTGLKKDKNLEKIKVVQVDIWCDSDPTVRTDAQS